MKQRSTGPISITSRKTLPVSTTGTIKENLIGKYNGHRPGNKNKSKKKSLVTVTIVSSTLEKM